MTNIEWLDEVRYRQECMVSTWTICQGWVREWLEAIKLLPAQSAYVSTIYDVFTEGYIYGLSYKLFSQAKTDGESMQV